MKTRLLLAQLKFKDDNSRMVALSCKGKRIEITLPMGMWHKIFQSRVTNMGTHRLLPIEGYGHLYVHIPSGYEARIWFFSSGQLPSDVMEPIIAEMTARGLDELEIETGSVVLESQRQAIPRYVQILVWQRDGGKCVKCESQEDLDFHYIKSPSEGGSNHTGNIQLLCAKCSGEQSV